MDKNKFFKIIIDIHEKYGYINRHLLKDEVKDFNVNWELSKYGGLKNISENLGLKYKQYSKLDPNDIIHDAQSVFEKHNTLSVEVYEKYGKYSKSAIRSHFGNFNNLLKQLDIPLNTSRNDSIDNVVRDFKKFHEIYHSTSSTIYRKYGSYSQSVIERLFGSWSNFMSYMGYAPIGQKVGAAKMIEDVKLVYEEYGYLSAKLINDNCSFTYQALRYRFNQDEISKAIGVDNAFTHKIQRISTGSKALYRILVNIYGEQDVLTEYHEDWLRNPRTGKLIYVDFYVKSKKIAVEYDGQQHYDFIEFIHRNYKNFFYQVYRDRIKDKKLKQHGIKVIRFRYDEPITDIYVKNKIENV